MRRIAPLFAPLFALCALLSAHLLEAQQPTVLHAEVSTVSAEHALAAQIDRLKREAAPVWVGYAIDVKPGFHEGGNKSRIALLEGGSDRYEDGHDQEESFDHVNLLMRIAGGHIEKMRLETPDRQLDAGGQRFVWLTGVAGKDSVDMLRNLVLSDDAEKTREEAVFFISLHQAPEATTALVQLATTGTDLGVREKAAFWLANQRGHEGFLAIQHLARTDASPAFREKLTFDLTLCHEPDAVDELTRMAKTDASPQVRRQAQFWMANIGGKKVVADLRNSASNDPDVEVRKAAVFAISRLPGEEATSQLIQVASTNGDPAVRKQAVFWLGQSDDPRALDYLTKLVQSTR